jgi:hypothetical protein
MTQQPREPLINHFTKGRFTDIIYERKATGHTEKDWRNYKKGGDATDYAVTIEEAVSEEFNLDELKTFSGYIEKKYTDAMFKG